MIFIFTDPGKTGGISAVDEKEQILFSVGLVDGLPPEGFKLSISKNSNIMFIDNGSGRPITCSDFNDCHFGVEIADLKNVEVGAWKKTAVNKRTGKPYAKKWIGADSIYKLGIYTGLIIQWFTERDVHDMLKVKPLEWQTIYKGFAGKDPKERAKNCLKEKYCTLRQPGMSSLWKETECKNCRLDTCPLKKHGIIGPRGGYNDGQGDSVCGALHLKNTARQRKVRK